MCQTESEGSASRFSRAISGEPGPPCVGVTFMPCAALRQSAWGVCADTPPSSAMHCSVPPDFAFVNSWEPDADDQCGQLGERGTVPLLVVRGPFDTLASRLGWSEALRLTAGPSRDIAPLLDEAVDEACTVIEQAGLRRCGMAGVVVAEDVAAARGPLLAPEFVLAEIIPRFGRIVRTVSESGMPTIWHSDGEVHDFLASAASTGLVGVHPGGLSAEAFGRLHALAQAVGLVVLGGIPGAALKDKGQGAVQSGLAASALAREGGLLVCDDGGISTEEEACNLIAALEVAREGERGCCGQ